MSFINTAHIRYYSSKIDDEVNTQQCLTSAAIPTGHDTLIIIVVKGHSMPPALPWHLVDEIYIPINSDSEYHWILAVVVLRERLIRVYDSLLGRRKREPFIEIQRLADLLSMYLVDSDFFEEKSRVDWSSVDAYKYKTTGDLIRP